MNKPNLASNLSSSASPLVFSSSPGFSSVGLIIVELRLHHRLRRVHVFSGSTCLWPSFVSSYLQYVISVDVVAVAFARRRRRRQRWGWTRRQCLSPRLADLKDPLVEAAFSNGLNLGSESLQKLALVRVCLFWTHLGPRCLVDEAAPLAR